MSYSEFYISDARYFLIYEDVDVARKFAWGSFSSELALLPVIQTFRTQVSTKITYSVPKEPMLLLQKNGIFWKVIIGEKIGWILLSREDYLRPLLNSAEI